MALLLTQRNLRGGPEVQGGKNVVLVVKVFASIVPAGDPAGAARVICRVTRGVQPPRHALPCPASPRRDEPVESRPGYISLGDVGSLEDDPGIQGLQRILYPVYATRSQGFYRLQPPEVPAVGSEPLAGTLAESLLQTSGERA